MKDIVNFKNSRNESFLFVQIPKGEDCDLSDIQFIDEHELAIGIRNPDPDVNNWITKYIQLPVCNSVGEKHTYTLILDVDNATGLQAHSVVDVSEHTIVLYKDYEVKQDGYAQNTDSLHSLVRSLNLDPNYNYVVLKIES